MMQPITLKLVLFANDEADERARSEHALLLFLEALLALQLPEETEGLVVGDRDRACCHEEIDGRIDELIALARESRIAGSEPDPDEEVRF